MSYPPSPSPATTVGAEVGDRPADRFMRRLLRVTTTDRTAVSAARGALRRSVVISAIRCAITYVVVPVLVPIIGFTSVVSAPVSIALCSFAMVNGLVSLRRFWMADHRAKWRYTVFIAIVFVLLTVALVLDVIAIVRA